jgi:hypothetical protein
VCTVVSRTSKSSERQIVWPSEMPAQRTGVIVTSGGPPFDHPTGRTCNSPRISTEPFVQVRTFLTADVTWMRVARAVALLAVLWWGWVTYTWLTDALSTEENVAEGVVIFAATAGMFLVALAVPTAFEEGALLSLRSHISSFERCTSHSIRLRRHPKRETPSADSLQAFSGDHCYLWWPASLLAGCKPRSGSSRS